MDRTEAEQIDAAAAGETPEDVAVLYSWANLHGAKYRDFSASRREYRAQMRHRAAQIARDSELRAKAEAEAAAAESEKAAREAEEAARYHEVAAREAATSARVSEQEMEEAAHERAVRAAAEMARRASMDRIEAARRAEAVAAAEAAAMREAREMAEAHASALRQAQRYQESESRRRHAAGPQPARTIGGQISDPYQFDVPSRPDRIFHQPLVEEDMTPSRIRNARETRLIVPQNSPQDPLNVSEFYATGTLEQEADIAAHGAAGRLAAKDGPVRFYEPDSDEKRAAVEHYARIEQQARAEAAARAEERARAEQFANFPAEPISTPLATPAPRRPQGYRPDEASGFHKAYTEPLAPAPGKGGPAWIYSQEQEQGRPLQAASPVHDSLQHSRERVASRWYALKGVFDHGTPEAYKDPAPQRVKDVRAPMLTIFSLAGGVGKTSMVATLGRALSASGEKVLLTDTTSHGLLPFYFGASELRPGIVRTFSPPAGSTDAPISLVSYDVNQRQGDAAAQEWLASEVLQNGMGMQRVLLDLSPSVAWVARGLVRMNTIVLVPVAPDMNSVISLQGVEKFFAGMTDADGRAVQPYYVLNQFDASMPLQLDVREVMRQQLGDRLLPFVIRRSPQVSEALAEGMTVVDYAPEAPVVGDYMNLAAWLRTHSVPAQSGLKNARWSER